ncbi:MAG: sugar ABC transporter permease [Chloroflexi bacterium]|nr:sugar ABC transporter permease [Chloroflexota bacterium]MCL5075676.1 sugar ABC transporter permease [Chloroflexota bacterium]
MRVVALPDLLRERSLESLLKERGLALLFLAPSLLVLLVLIGWSVGYALFLSFQNVIVVGGRVGYEFIGLRNYLAFLEDARLQQTLSQTFIYSVFRVTSIMLIAMVLALVLNRALFGIRIFKVLFLIPWALSYVVNALVWGWIYHGNFGVLNAILSNLRLIDRYHVWLAEPREAMAVIIFADVWKAVPFAALMLLAALQTVPRELEDAAMVDGAGGWACFRHITLPWLKPVILVLMVIETMWALKTFDLIWVLTKGGPLDATMVLNVYAYQQTFQFFNFGYGSAVAYLITMVILTLTWLYFIVLRGFEE